MSRLPNNPSIGWVHPKSTNVHPLAWGNNNCRRSSFELDLVPPTSTSLKTDFKKITSTPQPVKSENLYRLLEKKNHKNL
jgi:hypothetical protein